MRDKARTKAQLIDELVELRRRISALAKPEAESKEKRKRRMLAEKRAITEQLAGSIGHELHNILGNISNAAYFLNLAIEDPAPEVKEALKVLKRGVEASERIISSLRDFAHPSPPRPRKVDIHNVLQKALDGIFVPQSVEVVSCLDEALPMIFADPDQLVQIFGHLIRNAVQALPEGGRLVIKSEVSDPEWIAISFTDTGGGIAKEKQAKVFEPFFTTKARGIGLGLALTRTLVKKQGGTIELKSELGKRSVFTVKLPVKGL